MSHPATSSSSLHSHTVITLPGSPGTSPSLAGLAHGSSSGGASSSVSNTDDEDSAFLPLFDEQGRRDKERERRRLRGRKRGGSTSQADNGSGASLTSLYVFCLLLTVISVLVVLGSAVTSVTFSPTVSAWLSSLSLAKLAPSSASSSSPTALSADATDSPAVSSSRLSVHSSSTDQQQQQPALVPPTARRALIDCLYAELTAALPATIEFHSPAARPVHSLNRESKCWTQAGAKLRATLLTSTHLAAQMEYELAVRRMAASSDELDYYDPLDDRQQQSSVGPGIAYTHVPSRIIEWLDFDQGVASAESAGGGCEPVGLGHGWQAHRQSVYVGVDMAVRESPESGNWLHMYTRSANASHEVNSCVPTSGQTGQDQAHAEIKSVTTDNANEYFCPLTTGQPSVIPVAYFMSRHNVNTPWHVLIEHVYPHYINSYLRGDMPLTWDELVAWQPTHMQLYDWHLTGQHGLTIFEYWWPRLFGAEVVVMNDTQRVCCRMCVMSPPKVLSVYDYWQFDRFVFDGHSQVMVRLFRRHMFARNKVAAHDNSRLLAYSFQSPEVREALQQEYVAARGGQQTNLPPPYQLPDFAALLTRETEQRSTHQQGAPVTVDDLTAEHNWQWRYVMQADRTRLFSPTAYQSVNGSSPPRLTPLPLVVYAMRRGSGDRDVHEMERWWEFYQRPDVADSLPYHMLFFYVEDLPWQDQFTLLGRSAMLVAVEGAGLLNALMLPLRSVILELECTLRNYDGKRPLPWHQSLSQYLGHLHIQWSMEQAKCTFDQQTVERMHDTIVQSLQSRERNKYVYMF